MTDDAYELPLSEKYAEAIRNWDKVHSAYLNGKASREDDIAAWDSRRSTWADLKAWEESQERPDN